ncbi:plasmodesmata-located protein 2-like [Salvia splendens]|uniref:plasmodesmata-located protein 2-like n=1 Tax=Salvia splendens TaxID=180675 RepID=UPI001C275342|nr:plasmodesmata-located protein 2-like [Salvia splendens]
MGPSPIIFSLILSLSSIQASSSDYTTYVFKGCADQKFPDSNPLYNQNLKTLASALTSRSSAANYYKTSSGDGASAINGLYQCRGDLSFSDCSRCVAKATSMAGKLCGTAVAARVQLSGCYIRYEIAGFRQASATELVYKVCGPGRAGLGERLDAALGGIAKGVAPSRFYAGGYESVYVLGQCEGDLNSNDCVSCVKMAAESAKSECGSAVSAQIYMLECYISYTYYPNGAPTNHHSSSIPSSGRGKNTQQTVAIAMGGLAGMGLVTACVLFMKSAFKKKAYDDHHHHRSHTHS